MRVHGMGKLRHLAVTVPDLEQAIANNGGRFHMRVPGAQACESEQEFRDPNGVVFDIVNESYARRSWGVQP